MKYYSTRNNEQVDASYAILNAFDQQGGLFLPTNLVQIDINGLKDMSYQEIAYIILKDYFSEFKPEDLQDAIKNAYNLDNFTSLDISKINSFNNYGYLELFHGNTLAFKDMALSLYPYLLKLALKHQNNTSNVYILSATSGDTGKAALEAIKDIDGFKIAVLYPDEGVSDTQLEQMVKQEGANVEVIGIEGNFDDAQNFVKQVFNDEKTKQDFNKFNYQLVSANSINIARLMPQIVYYFDAYIKLVRNNNINMDDKVNVSVPTGNFGNILACFMAKEMGLPIDKIICASNQNNVIYDFFKTGIYDLNNRDLLLSIAPSMDILISSNLERYLCLKLGYEITNNLMHDLKENKCFKVNKEQLECLNKDILVSYSNDEKIKQEIKTEFNQTNYVLDPHTATAKRGYNEYKETNYTLIVATASFYKFSDTTKEVLETNDLFEKTKIDVPLKIKELKDKPIRFSKVMKTSQINDYLLSKLNGEYHKDFEVLVSATSANLGSGFDSIGLAVNLYNKFTFSYKDTFMIQGCDERYNNKSNLVYQTYESIIAKYKVKSKVAFNLQIETKIPISRGLGSSSTCIIAGVVAANIYHNLNLSQDEILYEAALIEKHPDNVAPAILGSLVACVLDDKEVFYQQVNINNNLDFYAVYGIEELATTKARQALPESITYPNAIYNIARSSILLKAFEQGNIKQIKVATQDKIHQDYRYELISNIKEITKVLDNKLIKAHWISGAGTTIMFVAQKRDRLKVEEYISEYDIDIERLDIVNKGTIINYL